MTQSSRKIKALVAEDSPAMRQLIVFALRRIKNIEVAEAEDGAAAMKLLSAEHFDILLTDINMPIMDGLKLVDLLRKGDLNKGIPIVVITTEGAQADRERAMTLGANAYITKPIQAPQVLECVRRLLNL
jgi:two-component system, chemotaxis family, chemotaxis protein CheY